MMNSTQQSMSRSLASLAKVMLDSESVVARISVIIFCTVAGKETRDGVSEMSC